MPAPFPMTVSADHHPRSATRCEMTPHTEREVTRSGLEPETYGLTCCTGFHRPVWLQSGLYHLPRGEPHVKSLRSPATGGFPADCPIRRVVTLARTGGSQGVPAYGAVLPPASRPGHSYRSPLLYQLSYRVSVAASLRKSEEIARSRLNQTAERRSFLLFSQGRRGINCCTGGATTQAAGRGIERINRKQRRGSHDSRYEAELPATLHEVCLK